MSLLELKPPSYEDYYNPGVSMEAELLAKEMQIIDNDIRNNAVLGGRLVKLERIFNECSEDDWDGNGCLAADRRSFHTAKEVLLNLPYRIREPDISVDPDGEISLEWYMSKSRLFSISIGVDGALAYLGFLGRQRMKGCIYFENKVPDDIRQLLETIVGRAPDLGNP